MLYSDGYEMREQHRLLLVKARVYLLHNLRPTEGLWSALIAKEVLAPDMVDDIKGYRTTNEKVGQLLDVLPTRGPEAFDRFCEVLLECDHAHVGDYLKTLEATDQFRTDIRPHCADFSDHMLDRFVAIFKRSTPMVTRFAERKFELILEEQERDLEKKDVELRDLESKNMMLQLEVSQLRSFLNTCYESSESIAGEVQREFVSRSFCREEKKHLENMKFSIKDLNGFEKVLQFYNNMQTLLTFLENHVGIRVQDPSTNNSTNNKDGSSKEGDGSRSGQRSARMSAKGKTLQEKMQILVNMLTQISDDVGGKTHYPGVKVRTEIDKVLKKLQEFIQDVFSIRDAFKNTLRQKRKMEGEILSLLHNFQEMRRLEREVKEKQSHIADLNKHGQLLKKKTKHHRKQLEQIQLDVEQKKLQMREIQKHLQRHVQSADTRLHQLLQLLPDLDDRQDQLLRSDTDITSETGSTLGRTLRSADLATISSSRRDSRQRLFGISTQEDVDIPASAATMSETKDNRTDAKDSVVDKKSTEDNEGNVKVDNSSCAKTGAITSNNKGISSGATGRLLSRPTRPKMVAPQASNRTNRFGKDSNVARTTLGSKVAQGTQDNKDKDKGKEKDSDQGQDKEKSGGDAKGKQMSEIDKWLANQEKALEEQRKFKEKMEQEEKARKKEAEKDLKKDQENGNNLDNAQTSQTKLDNGDKDVNANVVEDRQKSAEGSEKEKGWFEANKGSSASSKSSHESRPGSGSKSREIQKPEGPQLKIAGITDRGRTKDKLGIKDKYSSRERSISPMKRSTSRVAEGVMGAEGFSLTDPRASKLKQSYSNMIKEMTQVDNNKALKGRQALMTSNIELRLPSK